MKTPQFNETKSIEENLLDAVKDNPKNLEIALNSLSMQLLEESLDVCENDEEDRYFWENQHANDVGAWFEEQ